MDAFSYSLKGYCGFAVAFGLMFQRIAIQLFVASVFCGDGGKGSIKLVHHQNGLCLLCFKLNFLESSDFMDSSFYQEHSYREHA